MLQTVGYDAAVFTMQEFLPPDFPLRKIHVIPPAIDALSPKNIRLPEDMARQLLEWIGIGLSRPLITQVSRFDPWKDPLGVIDAYRLVREPIPNVQLTLVGSMALDDPEGWHICERIMKGRWGRSPGSRVHEPHGCWEHRGQRLPDAGTSG